jgi:hypothetical protein
MAARLSASIFRVKKITLCWFLAWLLLPLHGVISQKTELFIKIAVRTFNPTKLLFSQEVYFYNYVHFSITLLINGSLYEL